MTAEWPRVALRDCGNWLSGGTPSKRVPAYWNGDLPWVTSKDLHNRYVDDAKQCITDLGAANGTRVAEPGAILIVVRSMALAKGIMVGLTRRRVAFNQDVKAVVPREDILPQFLLFSLWGHQSWLRDLIDEASHGTKRLASGTLQSFQIPLPPMAEQEAIVTVLGAMDDKIESNLCLEATQLDVILTMYDHVSTTTVRRDRLASLGLISGGGTPRSKVADFWSPPTVPWVTPKDMTALAGSPVVWSGERFISEAGLAQSNAKLLEAGTVLYTSRATLGLVAVAQQPVATNQGFISVTPQAPFSSPFVYAVLRRCSPAIEAKANGSTFREVNKSNFKSVDFLRPAQDSLRNFDAVAEPAFAHVAGLVKERHGLAAIRDALLPKLVSGQIRVPLSDDPEEMVGAAVQAHEAQEAA